MKKLAPIVVALSLIFGQVCTVHAFDRLFDARIDYEVGETPEGVFSADFDGDSDLDLAVANWTDQSVSVLLNNGNGTFADAVNYDVGGGSWSVFSSDLDGDGDNDLAVAVRGGGKLAVLMNNGDGSFADPLFYDIGDVMAVVSADLDGDSDYDLAVAGVDGVCVMLNLGDGTFAMPIHYQAFGWHASIDAVDLDGDDDCDLALSCEYEGVRVFLNNGDGTFGTPTSWESGTSAYQCAVGDFDGDGDIDVATAGGEVSVVLNNGDGTFGAPIIYSDMWGASSICAGDLDGDGDLDLAALSWPYDKLAVLYNDGSGTFDEPTIHGIGHGPYAVLAADLDGEYGSDLAIVNMYPDNVSVLLCRGDGSLGLADNYEVLSYPMTTCSADFDRDGDNDLAVAHEWTSCGTLSVLMNSGLGKFAPAVGYDAVAGPEAIISADFNGDSYNDLAISTRGNQICIMLNNGDGTFADATIYGQYTHLFSVSIVSADLDGDGDIDLAASIDRANKVIILSNDGNGTFEQTNSYDVGSSASTIKIALADLDADGDADLVTANWTSEDVSILLNNGDGTFSEVGDYSAGTHPWSVCSADLDGDGDIDLAVTNHFGPEGYDDSVSVLLNDGDAAFLPGGAYLTGWGPKSVVSTDVDGDNDNDLVVGNYYEDNVSVLLNHGDGTFASAVNYGGGDGPASLVLADFDGDFDMDLAVTNHYSKNVSIMFNLTDMPPAPATVMEPDTVFVYYANAITPFELAANMGNFDIGYTANDVNVSSLAINSSVAPVSTAVLPSHPVFSGQALEVVFHAQAFLPGYGYPFDATVQSYEVAGEYFDGTPFEAVGQFILVGHISGDLNLDGQVDISDVVLLVDYMFNGGPEPPVMEAADVDCSGGTIDISDLVYLVDYMFLDGPVPSCGQ